MSHLSRKPASSSISSQFSPMAPSCKTAADGVVSKMVGCVCQNGGQPVAPPRRLCRQVGCPTLLPPPHPYQGIDNIDYLAQGQPRPAEDRDAFRLSQK